ncbi:fused response regulator/phosphatase [Actinomycetospora endophytica]|uniref:Fused response regulator/phosphatase n=1 Tax=Actinomycetospora endophytica TaxID=2291215 RepID=A0ABS8PA73_9PSEU|nr:fused response regulator/phosphatase [Actinomycetospora endophytica]MCD2194923.1 fused response regulator/phosphatase [Actinomycetospora endophytica]
MAQAVQESAAPMSVLLVEDDDGDALLVAEHFADAETVSGLAVSLQRVRTVAEAEEALATVECVLLDLALPDAHGLDALQRVLRAGDGPAVVVLTGRHDEMLGAEAVGAGAQDYLLKDSVDGPSLTRALRYAAERVRGERVRRQLWDANARAEENSRLERGLLPTPLVADPGVQIAVRYEPGGQRRLLGGDFYDAVEGPDGTLHVVIGDVCGHGPDEAALGVNLRIAWRAMILSGADEAALLPTLSRLLVHERELPGLFATLALLTIDLDERHARVRLAGHPPPILLQQDGPAQPLPSTHLGRPIGVLPDDHWEVLEMPLPVQWALLLYTDGLIEGRPNADFDTTGTDPDGDEGVLDTDGLLTIVEQCVEDSEDRAVPATRNGGSHGHRPWPPTPNRLLDRLILRVGELTDERADDVAAVLLVSQR